MVIIAQFQPLIPSQLEPFPQQKKGLSIGDLIETDLINLGKQRLKQEVHISPHTRQMLERIQREVAQLLAMAVEAVTENDAEKALRL